MPSSIKKNFFATPGVSYFHELETDSYETRVFTKNWHDKLSGAVYFLLE